MDPPSARRERFGHRKEVKHARVALRRVVDSTANDTPHSARPTRTPPQGTGRIASAHRFNIGP